MENTCVREHPLCGMDCSQSLVWPNADIIMKEVFEGTVKASFYSEPSPSLQEVSLLSFLPCLHLGHHESPTPHPGIHQRLGSYSRCLPPTSLAVLPITPDFPPPILHCCQHCPSSGPQPHCSPTFYFFIWN